MTPATTELSNGQLWRHCQWQDGALEDWIWQVKAYVSLFDDALECLEANTTELVDTELVKFSRQVRYLLAQTTSESNRLVVRGNTELNGFESWRLLPYC